MGFLAVYASPRSDPPVLGRAGDSGADFRAPGGDWSNNDAAGTISVAGCALSLWGSGRDYAASDICFYSRARRFSRGVAIWGDTAFFVGCCAARHDDGRLTA